MDMLTRIQQVFSSVLGIDGARLSEADSPATVVEWDSVAHISVMMAIEEEFGVTFVAEDLVTLNTIGRIRQRLESANA